MINFNTERHNIIESNMKHFNNLHKNTDPQNRIVPQGNYKLKQSYQKLGYLEIYKKLRHYGIVIGTDLYINEKK